MELSEAEKMVAQLRSAHDSSTKPKNMFLHGATGSDSRRGCSTCAKWRSKSSSNSSGLGLAAPSTRSAAPIFNTQSSRLRQNSSPRFRSATTSRASFYTSDTRATSGPRYRLSTSTGSASASTAAARSRPREPWSATSRGRSSSRVNIGPLLDAAPQQVVPRTLHQRPSQRNNLARPSFLDDDSLEIRGLVDLSGAETTPTTLHSSSAVEIKHEQHTSLPSFSWILDDAAAKFPRGSGGIQFVRGSSAVSTTSRFLRFVILLGVTLLILLGAHGYFEVWTQQLSDACSDAYLRLYLNRNTSSAPPSQGGQVSEKFVRFPPLQDPLEATTAQRDLGSATGTTSVADEPTTSWSSSAALLLTVPTYGASEKYLSDVLSQLAARSEQFVAAVWWLGSSSLSATQAAVRASLACSIFFLEKSLQLLRWAHDSL
ncbi:unnamed protein product [Amoebophrya sp. A120]|nr:unnamed protein product [Amoebophrya sp. A120]|eukprot:GSA120T00002248001.1